MSDNHIIHNDDEHLPPEAVAGAHDADGTTGRVAGTGSGAIAGGIVGSAAGPLGTIVGAIAGSVLGAAAGNAAHKIGDDHDDVNIHTGRDGEVGRTAGAGAGGVSGAVIGSAAGPVGTVVGAVAGGMLGAAAGDATKDMGGDDRDVPAAYAGNSATIDPIVGTTPAGTPYTTSTMTPGNAVPGVQTGGVTTAGNDTRGLTEKAADAVTGDRYDNKTGGVVVAGPNVTPGNNVSGVQTGGHAVDGTPDTRGVMEKTADAVTGDNLDDKTGRRV